MKTHTSLPDREDLYGVLYKKSRIIEYNIPKASSEDYAEEYVQQEIIEISFVYFAIFSYEKITKNEPKSIHESIPRGSNMDAEK